MSDERASQLLSLLGNESMTLSELEEMASQDETLPVLYPSSKGGRDE